jgi:hypothetical protein
MLNKTLILLVNKETIAIREHLLKLEKARLQLQTRHQVLRQQKDHWKMQNISGSRKVFIFT